MNAGRTVFSQLIEFLPREEFQKCVARYGADRYLKSLSCWDQYLAMAFAQLTYRRYRILDAWSSLSKTLASSWQLPPRRRIISSGVLFW
jgi:hypothetical protein